MNYYEAREIKDKDGLKGTGLYHFTVMRDGAVWPVGRCADGCPGHATKEEACEHYRQYIIHDMPWSVSQDPNTQHKCGICSRWTMDYYWHSTYIFKLCREHQNKESLEELMPEIGTIVSSW